jgi:predicted phage terminase large subunit-like protein
MNLNKIQLKAQAEMAKRELARRHVCDFASFVHKKYVVARHIKFIGDLLDKAIAGVPGYNKMIFHEPPQHGKSLQISKIFPALYIGKFPDNNIILTSYSDEHALSFSRAIRDYIDSKEYQLLFPGVSLHPDNRSAGRFTIAPPHTGGIVASGLQGRITGVGANLLIIDDPYKNREEVESKLIRGKIEESYRSTLKTRLADNAIQIVVMTRWRKDDLAGYLQDTEKSGETGWKYICLSALAREYGDEDPLNRRKYEPLWPWMHSQRQLMEVKRTIGSYNWNSMYRGRPSPSEGMLFKRSMFEIIDKAPQGLMWSRYWDLAVGETDRDAYTASVRESIDSSGNRIFADMIRVRKEWPEIRKLIKATALRESEDLNGHIFVGVESQGPQKGMIQECYADPELAGVGIMPVPVSQSKRVRALPLSAAGEAGKIKLVKGIWNDAFIQEMCEFDTGDYDDQVDAATGANKLLAITLGSDLMISDLSEIYAGVEKSETSPEGTEIPDEVVLTDSPKEESMEFFYS